MSIPFKEELRQKDKVCPKCGNMSIQEFHAPVVTYYRCQYCRHAWRGEWRDYERSRYSKHDSPSCIAE